jgi:hypothetical protein
VGTIVLGDFASDDDAHVFVYPMDASKEAVVPRRPQHRDAPSSIHVGPGGYTEAMFLQSLFSGTNFGAVRFETLC